MKKILVPIDFTEYSINALRFATYIAKTKGMAIKLLHVIEEPRFQMAANIPFVSTEMIEHEKQLEIHTLDHLKRLVALEIADGLIAEYEVRPGKAGVVKEILRDECDLIVMGRRREENDEVIFLGSVAEKTVRLSHVPVITVGNFPKNYAIKNMVFASDFEDEELKAIIERAIHLSEIFNAELHFLYVALYREFLNEGKTRESLEYQTSKFDLKDHEVEIYVADSQEEGITQYVKDNVIDLVAMGTHGRSGLANFFVGSVAENLSEMSTVPVLTYNINKKKIERVARPITREQIITRKKSGKEAKK